MGFGSNFTDNLTQNCFLADIRSIVKKKSITHFYGIIKIVIIQIK